jgi:hypothetical protein
MVYNNTEHQGALDSYSFGRTNALRNKVNYMMLHKNTKKNN